MVWSQRSRIARPRKALSSPAPLFTSSCDRIAVHQQVPNRFHFLRQSFVSVLKAVQRFAEKEWCCPLAAVRISSSKALSLRLVHDNCRPPRCISVNRVQAVSACPAFTLVMDVRSARLTRDKALAFWIRRNNGVQFVGACAADPSCVLR